MFMFDIGLLFYFIFVVIAYLEMILLFQYFVSVSSRDDKSQGLFCIANDVWHVYMLCIILYSLYLQSEKFLHIVHSIKTHS
jgi:hypothetical protein